MNILKLIVFTTSIIISSFAVANTSGAKVFSKNTNAKGVVTKTVINNFNDTNPGEPGEPEEPFPDPVLLEPIRYGHSVVKVTKSTTKFENGTITTEEETVCRFNLGTPIYDTRNVEGSYALNPGYGSCHAIYKGNIVEIGFFSAANLEDNEHVDDIEGDTKSFWAGSYLDGGASPEDSEFLSFPAYDVTTKDLGLTNVIFRDLMSSVTIGIPCKNEPDHPVDPENRMKSSQTEKDKNSDGDYECPTEPIEMEPIESFFVSFEINDAGAE